MRQIDWCSRQPQTHSFSKMRRRQMMTDPHFDSRQLRDTFLSAIAMLCRVFWGPGDRLCRELLEDAALQPLELFSRGCGGAAAADFEQLQAAVNDFGDPDSLCEHLEPAYVRLFVSHRGGIAAPLYQSCYEGENAPLMGRPALEMKARLENRGLNVSASLHEPPDHLAIELEYLYFLLEKGWREGNDNLIDEAARFSSAVMLPWLTEFNQRLADETQCRFYPLTASLVVHLLSELGVQLTPDTTRLS
jgi:TorA-specific chaperone